MRATKLLDPALDLTETPYREKRLGRDLRQLGDRSRHGWRRLKSNHLRQSWERAQHDGDAGQHLGDLICPDLPQDPSDQLSVRGRHDFGDRLAPHNIPWAACGSDRGFPGPRASAVEEDRKSTR